MTEFGPDLKEFAKDMLDTLIAAPGAGLAAPQVARNIRLIVIDDSEIDEPHYVRTLTLVNPEITAAEGKQVYKEGCLSVTDLEANVNRSERVEVSFLDLDGNPRTLSAEGRKAVILQHEIDHLDGILFIDHLSPLKREMYVKSLRKKKKDKDKEPQKS